MQYSLLCAEYELRWRLIHTEQEKRLLKYQTSNQIIYQSPAMTHVCYSVLLQNLKSTLLLMINKRAHNQTLGKNRYIQCKRHHKLPHLAQSESTLLFFLSLNDNMMTGSERSEKESNKSMNDSWKIQTADYGPQRPLRLWCLCNIAVDFECPNTECSKK